MRNSNMIEDMVDYSRGASMAAEMGDLNGYSHIIVGCGGIGWWLAIMATMQGAAHIVLVDGDKVEPSNLPRLPAPLRSIEQYKVKVLKAQLRLLRPTVRVTCIPAHITAEMTTVMDQFKRITASPRMLWDCTDDAVIQQALSRFCRQDGAMHYTKLGYEGFNIGAYSSTDDAWITDDYRPGYRTTKANVMSSAMAAAMGLMYGVMRFTGKTDKLDVSMDMKAVLGGNR